MCKSKGRLKSIESTVKRLIAKAEGGDYDQLLHMVQSLVVGRDKKITYLLKCMQEGSGYHGNKRQANMIDGGIVSIKDVFGAMENAGFGDKMLIDGDKINAHSRQIYRNANA